MGGKGERDSEQHYHSCHLEAMTTHKKEKTLRDMTTPEIQPYVLGPESNPEHQSK